MISHLSLRLGFWLLLTADTSMVNMIIGILAALALPRKKAPCLPLTALFLDAWKVMKILPIAYLEAFSLFILSHTEEEVTTRFIGMDLNPRPLFLEIFLINFSPKSIVLQVDEQRRIHIHHIRHRNRS